MFEHLPILTQSVIKPSYHDVEDIIFDPAKVLLEIEATNPWLSRLVQESASICAAAVNDPDMKDGIEFFATISILISLRMIDREIELHKR